MTQPLDFSMRLNADGSIAVREAGKVEESIKRVSDSTSTLNRQSAESTRANDRLIESWARYAATLGKSKSEVMELEARVRGMNAAQMESVRSIQQVIEVHEQAQRSARDSAAFMGTLANAGKAVAVALAALFGVSIKNAQEAEQAGLRLDAVLKATGQQANVSRAQIDGYAEALAATTRFDDDAIRSGAATLLTFQNIGASSFERVLKAGTDLAAFMNSDLDAAMRLVGKAMEDPEHGATALRRAGILLSDSQLELVKSATAAGDSMTAQRVILEALEQRIGGVAETMNSGLAKATSDTAKAFGELTESIGKSSVVAGTYTLVMGTLTKAMQQLKALADDGWVATDAAPTRSNESPAESARLAAFGRAESEAAEKAANAYNMKWAAIDKAREAFAKMAAQYADKDAKFAATAAEIRRVGEAAGLSAATIEGLVAAADKATFGAEREAAARKDAADKARVYNQALRDMKHEAGEEAKAHEKARKELEAWNTQLAKAGEPSRRFVAELEKSAEQLEQEAARQKKANDEMQYGVDVVADLTVAKLAAAVAAKELAGENDKEYDSLVRQLAAARDLGNELRRKAGLKASSEAAKEAERDWLRTAETIRDGLTDAFLNAASSGRNFFRSLAGDLQRMFSQLVLRPIIQGVMAPVAGAITGALGFSGNAGASGLGGGLGNYASTGSSLMNLSSTSASWASTASGFALSGTGEALGLSTTVFDSAAGASAALTVGGEALATLAAAAPYIAAVVAIAYMAYQAFGQQPGGPKAGGYAFSGTGMTPWNRKDQFSDGGFQPGHFTPNQMDSALQPIVNDWTKGLAATVKAFGGTANAQAAFDLGIDRDPAGEAANRLGIRASVNGRQVYNYWSGDDALGRDDQALQSAIELESKRALLAALQASDLPAQIGAVFDTMQASTASSGQIDNLMAFGAAMKSVLDSIGGDVLGDATAIWDDAQRTQVEHLQDMGAEVIRLAGAMDGTTESMQALAGASQTYRQAVTQVLLAIRSVAQHAQQMQGSLVQSIQNWGMTPGQSFNYWIAEANSQALGLGTATSPEQVDAIATATYGAVNRAFNALPDELKDAYRPALLGFLSEFGSGVNQALINVKDATLAGTQDPFKASSTAIDGAAGKFDSAATSISNAGSDFKTAVADMKAAVADFRAALPLQVEVVNRVSEV